MKLLDDLHAEHALIERVVGSLHTFVASGETGGDACATGAAYARFFRLYAGQYHHAREEHVLFPAMIEETEVPAGRGPIAVVTAQHRELEQLLAELEDRLAAPTRTADGQAELLALARRHGEMLLHHIDAEDSVLFPECEARLLRCSITELPTRPPDAAEEAARADGVALVARYAPSQLPDVWRGDGCVACPAYGKTCDGIEREWWSELEWEDLFTRQH